MATNAETPKTSKPLLWSDSRTDAEKFDPSLHRGALDPSRIPGYSEIVQANDINKADDLVFREQNQGRTKDFYFKQIGASPRMLDVEFKWLRITGPGGADSSSAARELDVALNQEGFRLANVNDLESNGCSLPPSARKAEDGTIRRGPDVALYVRSGEVARLWERYLAEETARQEGSLTPSMYATPYGAVDTFEVEREHKQETITH